MGDPQETINSNPQSKLLTLVRQPRKKTIKGHTKEQIEDFDIWKICFENRSATVDTKIPQTNFNSHKSWKFYVVEQRERPDSYDAWQLPRNAWTDWQ